MLILKDVFSSGAVFMENAVTEIKGRTEPGAQVKAALKTGRKTLSEGTARADAEGLFSVPLNGPEGSFTKYKVKISSGDDNVTLENVMFGQVWLASGQSNMEFVNMVMENADRIYEQVKDLPIYFLGLKEREKLDGEHYYGEPYPLKPVFSTPCRWHSVSDRGAYNTTSAVAVRVSAMICHSLKDAGREMPVAFLNLPIGGSVVEDWLPEEICEGELKEDLIKVNHYSTDGEPSESVKISPFQRQTVLYNAMIAPVAGMKCRGVLWYQGESNCCPCKTNETRAFFKKAMLIYHREYKKMFGIPGEDFPVVCSLLFPWVYGDDSLTRMGYINMGMVDAAAENREIAVAPIYDLPATWPHYYDYHPIHPSNKEGVALRIGEIVTGRCYGGDGMPSAAYVKGVKRHRDCVDLRFETFGRPLWSPDDEIKGFYVAGSDGVYVPAQAVISTARTVRVFSRFVANPKNVCYQMADMQQDGSLYCGNLPASPVATDAENALRVPLLPWTEPSVDSQFRRGTGNDLDFFMYPVRYPEDGSSVCYDPSYDMVRILDENGDRTCGMYVKSVPFLPLDVTSYGKMEFVCDCQPQVTARIEITYVRNGKTIVRTPAVDREVIGTTGTSRFSVPLRFRKTDRVEKIRLLFDLSASAYPTVAVGRIEFSPK